MKYITIFFLILITFSLSFAATPSEKMNPALHLLLALKERPEVLPKSELAPINSPNVDIGVRFSHSLSPNDIADLENDDCIFIRINSKIYTVGNCYGMKVKWEYLNTLSAREDVLQISSHWQPKVVPCLDVSNPEVQANLTWGLPDPNGLPVTGEGVLVADFDTGIDVYHPAFFQLTSDTLDWLDVDQDDAFTPGTDAVDLNHNSEPDSGETLNFFDGNIYDVAATFGGSNGTANNDTLYQPEWDWLYNDADNSGVREYGWWEGFQESNPTYGEPLFVGIDENHNSQLDIGEKLIALGESKVYATMNGGDIPRFRGTDLIYTDPDYGIHGTAVCGIIAGGFPGITKFTGVAPEADLIMGSFFSGVSFDTYLPWVESLGCKILLYEFGGWVYQSLDGSSYEEQIMDMEASLGVMQIAPSGNLNRGEKHCLTDVIPNDTTFIDFAVNIYSGAVPSAVYITVLWREPDVNLNFGIGVPGGLNILLNGNGSWQTVPPYSFYSYRSTSQRGTAEYDITIYDTDLTGDWILFIDNNYSATSEINGYIADDVSAWEGGAEFTEFLSNMKTCTWPSTADSAFVLGSYSTRGYEQYIGVGSGSIQPGQLSKFSGRGPRIDGVHILSLISPGNYDVYTTRAPFDPPYTFGGWRQFSGTSAAGPHVAGSAALLKQGLLDASQFEIGWILSQNTFRDQFTGSDYNDSCGYGKVRVYDALYSTGVIDLPEVEMPRSFSVEVHPNPFNPEAEIEFYLPISGITKAKIYDLLGREVAVLSNHWLPAGDHYMTWNANGFASGVYFLQIKSGKYSSVKKLLVLK